MISAPLQPAIAERSSPAAAGWPAGLIVVDESDPALQTLVRSARLPVAWLPAGGNPLANLTGLLAAQPCDVLHLVAHGRVGALQLGGSWFDTAALRAHADQLAQWRVGRIALWSCHVGADGEFVDTLSRLTGAEVVASDSALGRTGSAMNWKLHGRDGHGSSDGTLSWHAAASVFDVRVLAVWDHQLAPARGRLHV